MCNEQSELRLGNKKVPEIHLESLACDWEESEISTYPTSENFWVERDLVKGAVVGGWILCVSLTGLWDAQTFGQTLYSLCLSGRVFLDKMNTRIKTQ